MAVLGLKRRKDEGGTVPPAPPAPPPQKKKPRLKKLRFLFVLLGLGILAVVSMIFGMMAAISQDLPAIYNFAEYKASKNSEIYGDNGEALGTLTSDQNKILLNSSQISPNIKNAVVAIEDARFYEHNGVDFKGIGRALVSDILSQSAQQGASTITEQFVKNALEAAGMKPEVAEVTMRAENSIELTGDDAARMQKLLDVLEDLDDVQDVFHNAELA